MGYREDPEARSTLQAALTGLGAAIVFLLIVGSISFFLAKNATPAHGPAAGTPGAAAQH